MIFSWLKCLSHELVSVLLLLYKSFLMVTHHGALILFYTLVETPAYNYHDKNKSNHALVFEYYNMAAGYVIGKHVKCCYSLKTS